MSDLSCPECGAEVPSNLEAGIGPPPGIGPAPIQPESEFAVCPSCGAELIRNTAPPMDRWRRQGGDEG
jgi:hypothetical protein